MRKRLTRQQASRAKYLLKIKGRTQREVALLLGVSQPAICKLATGKSHKAVPWPLREGEAAPPPPEGAVVYSS